MAILLFFYEKVNGFVHFQSESVQFSTNREKHLIRKLNKFQRNERKAERVNEIYEEK